MADRPTSRQRAVPRVLVAALAAFAAALIIARLDLRPSLSHVHVRLLSGPAEGNYHALAAELSAAAAKKRGRIENVATAGSMDNLARLAGAAGKCDVQAALVQAGLPMPPGKEMELYGRLAKAESMFFLGKNADRIKDFVELKGMRVGIGPEGSGTAHAARRIFESREMSGLGVALSHHTNAEQVDLAVKGDLDLAVFVMDEDAAFIASAVRDRGLQIADFAHADVIARRFPFLRHGRIGAGQFDAVRMLPPTDRRVLRVDTLVVGNGCARRSQIMGLMAALNAVFPDFVRHNRETPNATGLEVATNARSFLDNHGPEMLDEYLPRVADVMPPSNWVHLIMAVSILFNFMGVGNRFALWRIDAARVRVEREIASWFGPTATLGDIARMSPEGELLSPKLGAEIDRMTTELYSLAARCRKLSLSVLAPMGGEMAYRYQEGIIHETIAVLRGFRERWEKATNR